MKHCNTMTEYQIKASMTAIYHEQYKIAYPFLGLIGEVGELTELLTKYEDVDKDKISGEVGDVYWYIAAVCNDLQIKMEDIPSVQFNTGLILIETCKLGNDSKKLLRDGMTPDQLFKVIQGMGMILHFIRTILDKYKISEFECLNANLEKLFSRKDRGTLKGSGENR